MVKTLFILLLSIVCCSFAFKVVEIHLSTPRKFKPITNLHSKEFENHRSDCPQCKSTLNNINVFPCTKGFDIIFKEARKYE